MQLPIIVRPHNEFCNRKLKSLACDLIWKYMQCFVVLKLDDSPSRWLDDAICNPLLMEISIACR
jgi:hypothetical protein